jgi:PTH1 family peptidyl-tRNA hydrolase
MANFLVVGLGNPGEEYGNTRHNIGVLVLDRFARAQDAGVWRDEKGVKAKTIKLKVEKNSVLLVAPQTLMNESGLSLKPFFKAGSGTFKPEQLIVIHDDMDLALGTFKISFNRGSGGHRGIESIINSIKSNEFARIRVGVSPVDSKGLIKKPKGEEAVVSFILGKFKPDEQEILKKVSKQIMEALNLMLADSKSGREKAMGAFN